MSHSTQFDPVHSLGIVPLYRSPCQALDAGLVERSRNPGDFKEIEYSKSINPDEVEGLSVLITTVVGGGGPDNAGSLMLQHK